MTAILDMEEEKDEHCSRISGCDKTVSECRR